MLELNQAHPRVCDCCKITQTTPSASRRKMKKYDSLKVAIEDLRVVVGVDQSKGLRKLAL